MDRVRKPAAAPVPGPKQTGKTALLGESRAAKLALELLELPSRKLARQLVSLQDSSGAFLETDGTQVSPAEQALALLALAKAKSMYGPEMDEALQKAWTSLKAASPSGLGCKEAVGQALKGTSYWNAASVKRELAALSAILVKL